MKMMCENFLGSPYMRGWG